MVKFCCSIIGENASANENTLLALAPWAVKQPMRHSISSPACMDKLKLAGRNLGRVREHLLKGNTQYEEAQKTLSYHV